MSHPERERDPYPRPDRLGDAIRELARTMAEQGRSSMRFRLVSDTQWVTYEVRLVSALPRAGKRPTNHDSRITEVKAFGPEHGSRQKAENEKE